jgi:hypothetical protein
MRSNPPAHSRPATSETYLSIPPTLRCPQTCLAWNLPLFMELLMGKSSGIHLDRHSRKIPPATSSNMTPKNRIKKGVHLPLLRPTGVWHDPGNFEPKIHCQKRNAWDIWDRFRAPSHVVWRGNTLRNTPFGTQKETTTIDNLKFKREKSWTQYVISW